MKKIISLISVLALLLSMLTTVAFAEATNSVAWEEISKTESTITLKLVVTSDKAITTFTCALDLSDAIASGVTSVIGTKISASNFNADYAKKVIAVNYASTDALPAGKTELGEVTFTFSNLTKSFTTPQKKNALKVLDDSKANISSTFTVNAYTQEISAGSKDIPVESITLNKEAIELDLNGTTTETLIETVLPADATDPTVTWESDRPEIATVDGGKVTAVAEGEAKITATAGGKTATCKVTVIASDTKVDRETIGEKGAYGGKTLIKLGKIFKNASAKSFIALTNTTTEETRTSSQTIADLLGGETVGDTTIDVEITVGVLTENADDVFTFGLVE